MSLLSPGYWPSTYWPEDYWYIYYWPIFRGPICNIAEVSIEITTPSVYIQLKSTTTVNINISDPEIEVLL